jgi:hypothetical protein
VEVIAMKLIRNTLAAGLAVAAISLGACSSQHGSTGTSGSNGGPSIGSINGNPGQGDLGSVGMHLSIASGINVFALNWTISNGTNSYPGTVNIGDAQSIEFVAGGILAGTGYIVTLSGSDSAGDPCTGASAAVTVVAGATSSATVVVTCTSATDASIPADVGTGSVAVDAGVVLVGQAPFLCPGINSLAISPAEVLPPQTAALSSATTAFSGGTETVLWTTSCSGANIAAPTALNTTFACGSSTGLCTVTLTVGLDGNAADGGATTNQVCGSSVVNGAPFVAMSETINCEVGTLQCFGGQSVCTTTDGGAPYCASLNTDNNNCGTCGTVCTGANTCGIVGSATVATCNPPPAVPCTGGTVGANTPAGCVPCLGSANGICTATEQVVMKYDIAANGITPSSATTKAASCYYCMVAGTCLDSVAACTVTGVTTHGKTNLECEDTGTGNDSSASPADCRDALSCVITGVGANGTVPFCTTVDKGAASTDPNASVSNCYCGTNLGSACISPGPNGPCVNNMITDVGSFQSPAVSDPTDILSDFTTSSLSPGGVGNQILNCALTAGCNNCFN